MFNQPQAITRPVVLAAVAHPDDIEFRMAGTLRQLQAVGAEIHLWSVANGHGGTVSLGREEIIQLRWQEAQAAARVLGATIHPPLFDDLDVFYDRSSLAKVASVVRAIRPDIVLTHPLEDYMEDHQNAARLIVTAVFSRGIANFATEPPQPTYTADVALYHCVPQELCDRLRRPVTPEFYIDISEHLATKRAMLAQHRSQQEWLSASQGMNSFQAAMENEARRLGQLSGRFEAAEGWWRHAYSGFGPAELHPLKTLLGDRYTTGESR